MKCRSQNQRLILNSNVLFSHFVCALKCYAKFEDDLILTCISTWCILIPFVWKGEYDLQFWNVLTKHLNLWCHNCSTWQRIMDISHLFIYYIIFIDSNTQSDILNCKIVLGYPVIPTCPQLSTRDVTATIKCLLIIIFLNL